MFMNGLTFASILYLKVLMLFTDKILIEVKSFIFI